MHMKTIVSAGALAIALGFAGTAFAQDAAPMAMPTEIGGQTLSEADAERAKFERDIVKRVGAPLLGAFSFASGAVMMTNVINPKTITGAPLDWLLGGNPLLEGVWFFGNGMVCFKTSYDFFMIALDDHEEVQKMVKEIKGLLPVGQE